VLVPAGSGTGWHLWPRAASEVAVMATEIPCSNGFAGQFACRDVDLVAFVSIADLGGSAGEGLNDIWG
jgi:hypothetical protein